MAERITKLYIQAFRGIPGNFVLDFQGGRSWIALGDNATGKSSIADAIEWYFEGQIEFLRKEGRTDAIRHSGAAEDCPTVVTLDTDGSLGGTVTPDSSPAPGVIEVGNSELFMLRGRSLAQFVEKTKGEKWQAFAELLGLDAIDGLRRDLQYVRNALRKQKENCREQLNGKESALGQIVSQVSEQGILGTMKAKCDAAEVKVPESIQEALDPVWIKAVVPDGSANQRTSLLRSALANLREVESQPMSLDPIDSWNKFIDEGKRDVLTLSIYKAADSFLNIEVHDTGHCPLCGQTVNTASLRHRISTALMDLESAEQKLNDARQTVRQFVENLRRADQKRTSIFQTLKRHGIVVPQIPSGPYEEIDQQIEANTTVNMTALREHQREVGAWDTATSDTVQAATPPPASTQEQALVDIGVLHSQALEWRSTMRSYEVARFTYGVSEQVYSSYQERQRNYFKQIIGQISLRTADYYSFLHDSEGIDHVTVETIGETGAELSVDYFGKKETPPQRVLSESHLNSLGLALFLAMAETFNDRIGFLVLDDVVSSFDREHRGRLAELLVNEFTGTQLLILTHDEQFFDRISVLAPLWVTEQFTSWSYQGGPRTRRFVGDKLLIEASEELSDGNRVGATQKGRRALEEFLQEACEALEALLPFRRGQRNDHRMAQEVMNGLRRTLKSRAKPMYKNLNPLLILLEADLQACLNVESHASQGSTSNQEVNDTLDRISDLRGHFTCGDCSTRIWHTGTPQYSRCKCGAKSFPPASATATE